jgi:16S rRNA (guanine966-N2)-methyltransferase
MKRGRLRIVGGSWRSRIIRFAEREGVRPTPDRVRETLFNWLGQELRGKSCLDLFAGSGALGLEAASRGAQRVVMVERDRAAAAAIRENLEAFGGGPVELRVADALEFLREDRERYDIIFLDPPFLADYWPQLWALLPERMQADAVVYCESARPLDPPPGWEIRKSGRAGQVRFQLLKRTRHEQ